MKVNTGIALERLAEPAKKSERQPKPRDAAKEDFSSSRMPHPIIQLQRTLGNRAVAELIRTKRLTREGRFSSVQPKLTVGAPNDRYEQEAERISKQVVAMPDPAVRNETSEEDQPSLVRGMLLAATITPALQQSPSIGGETKDGSFDVDSSVEAQLSSSKGLGSPLPDEVRRFMEPRFSADFKDVRLHTGGEAASMNEALGAKAFTHGANIYFGSGHDPHDLELTAHELTHVVQQKGVERPVRRRCDVCNKEGATCPKCAAEKDDEAVQRCAQSSAGVSATPPVTRKPVEEQHRCLKASQDAEELTGKTNGDDAYSIWGTLSVIQSADRLRHGVQRQPEDSTPRDAGVPIAAGVADPGETPDVLPEKPELTKSMPGNAPRKVVPAPAPQPVASAAPAGFTSAVGSAAPCPDAPEPTVLQVDCPTALPEGAEPHKKEAPVLPELDDGPFGRDAKVEAFASSLAGCRAVRIAHGEVEKRYKAALESAKKQATADAKVEAERAMADAVANANPKNGQAVAIAKKQARADARRMAQQKIVDAQSAVEKPLIEAVTVELTSKFRDQLQGDYTLVMQAAVNRFGATWRGKMKAAQDREMLRLTKEKNAKPKPAKGEAPAPAHSQAEIAASIETEMGRVRCEQLGWAENQIEQMKHGWMVSRREQLDFDTIPQRVAELKDFRPGRVVPEAELVPVPVSVQQEPNMAKVAPEVADFLTSLRTLEPDFTAENYRHHGLGAWADAGFSVDLRLVRKESPLDDRGFYQSKNAVRFLLNLNQTAKAFGATWRVLYNDFRAAEEVNQATGTRNVVFIGGVSHGDLVWHGPAPMILHFHLDIQLPAPADAQPTAVQSSPGVTTVPPATSSPPGISRYALGIQREPAKPSSHVRKLEGVGARWIGRINGTDSAALRSTPSKDPDNPHAGTLADLHKGEFVEVIGRRGGWLKVTALVGGKETEGYVSHELIDFNRWDLEPDAVRTGLTMREALVVLKRAETSKKSDPKYQATASEKAKITAAIVTVKGNSKYQVNEDTFEVTFAKQGSGKIKVTTMEDFVLFVEAVEAQYPAASAKEVVSEIRQIWYSDENWELLIDSEGIHDGGKQVDIETPPNPLAQMFDMADLAPKAGGKVISTPMGETDVGHVLAGIDAQLSGGPASYPKDRLKNDSATSRFKFENLKAADQGDPTAFATFAGDLGQAYASFIFDRYEKKDEEAKLGYYISTFAKPAELTGDIQGYIAASVASDVRSSGGSPTGQTDVKASSIIRDMFLVDKSSMGATTGDYLEKVAGKKGKELNDYIYSTSIEFALLWYAKLVSDNEPEMGVPGELFEDYEQEFSERSDRYERNAKPDETLAGAIDILLQKATTKLQ